MTTFGFLPACRDPQLVPAERRRGPRHLVRAPPVRVPGPSRPHEGVLAESGPWPAPPALAMGSGASAGGA